MFLAEKCIALAKGGFVLQREDAPDEHGFVLQTLDFP